MIFEKPPRRFGSVFRAKDRQEKPGKMLVRFQPRGRLSQCRQQLSLAPPLDPIWYLTEPVFVCVPEGAWRFGIPEPVAHRARIGARRGVVLRDWSSKTAPLTRHPCRIGVPGSRPETRTTAALRTPRDYYPVVAESRCLPFRGSTFQALGETVTVVPQLYYLLWRLRGSGHDRKRVARDASQQWPPSTGDGDSESSTRGSTVIRFGFTWWKDRWTPAISRQLTLLGPA